VAAIAMIATPAYSTIGMAASRPTTMHENTGVCSFGLTCFSTVEPGSTPSRDMPKQSRIVDVMIERQHTKIAAATTSRNTVENALPKFASMICAGPQPSLIATPMSGMPSSMA
jgi:hypothetical protein